MRLLSLSPLLLALACGTNDNTVATQPGAGSGGQGGSGGSGTGGTGTGGSTGGAGVGSGGTSETGGVGGTGGTGMGAGGTSGAGASSATGGTESGGDGGTGVGGAGGSGASGGDAGVGGTGTGGSTGGGAGTSGEGGSGGDLSPSPCVENTDCVVRPQSCCGSCGVATRDDMMALNREDAELYATEMCGQVACPACAAAPDPTLVATCNDGFCAVVDILDHELTACTDPSDCRLRTIDCCECGGRLDPNYLIAISKDSGVLYSELACPSGTGCAACVPQYPSTPLDCVEGHCRIVP